QGVGHERKNGVRAFLHVHPDHAEILRRRARWSEGARGGDGYRGEVPDRGVRPVDLPAVSNAGFLGITTYDPNFTGILQQRKTCGLVAQVPLGRDAEEVGDVSCVTGPADELPGAPVSDRYSARAGCNSFHDSRLKVVNPAGSSEAETPAVLAQSQRAHSSSRRSRSSAASL